MFIFWCILLVNQKHLKRNALIPRDIKRQIVTRLNISFNNKETPFISILQLLPYNNGYYPHYRSFQSLCPQPCIIKHHEITHNRLKERLVYLKATM